MKVFALLLAVLSTSAIADKIEIDWSTVRPIELYPKFWDNKPEYLRPPAAFFTDVEENRIGRIVGGDIAQPHGHPYQVAIVMFLPTLGGNALCGGTVLSAQTVMTAAHCIIAGGTAASSGTVILGAHDRTNINEPGQVRVVVATGHLRIHPLWDESLIRNDIGLIILPTAVTLSAQISPATLPSAELGNSFAGEQGTITGFGVFSDDLGIASDVVRVVYDEIMTNTLCVVRFPGVVQPSNICITGTNGRGACSGDSGGPMTVQRGGNSMVVGVVSFGLALGCELSWPSVFARVTSFNDFIQQHLV